MEAFVLCWAITWLVCGIICSSIAESKGRSGCGWFLIGTGLGVFGLIWIAALPAGKLTALCP